MGQQKDDATIRPDGRQDKKRAGSELKNKTSVHMSSWWAKDDTRHQKEDRDEGLNSNKIQQKVTKTKQNWNIG